jgi:hypothetical protein
LAVAVGDQAVFIDSDWCRDIDDRCSDRQRSPYTMLDPEIISMFIDLHHGASWRLGMAWCTHGIRAAKKVPTPALCSDLLIWQSR